MKMKKIFLSLTVLLGMSTLAFAQSTEKAKNAFTPGGKPTVTVFSDFFSNSSNNKSNNGFEVSRAYLGYKYDFSPNFSGKIVFDIANTASLKPSAYTAFLKNAYAEYSYQLVKADFGLIGENMFSLQESVWGKRYLYKSFQDQYGFGSSADLGAKINLQFTPDISLDLSVLNGEGYKNVQADSTVLVAAGLTVKPLKNLYARVYTDYMKKEVAQTSFNAYVGYKSKKGNISAEYNLQNGHGMIKDQNFSGLSLYGTLNLAKQFSVFARYDHLSSDKIGTATNGWNSKDGQVYIAGAEFVPVKGIQIAPNIRYSDLTVGESTTSFYVNFCMSF